jgi:uncharacterized protein YbjT (DUF2867 family)
MDLLILGGTGFLGRHLVAPGADEEAPVREQELLRAWNGATL